MPVIQRRLLFLAIGQVQATSDEGMWLGMQVTDVVKALGMSHSGESYRRVREAIRGLMSQVLHIERTNGDWALFQWVSYAGYTRSEDRLDLEINRALRPYILELQGQFSRIAVQDFGKLTGRYSQRLYELIMAAGGHEGKQGNPPGQWWYRVETDKLRELFMLTDGEYKETRNFRRSVVDRPVQEINEADIGLHVTVEYHRYRRRLVGFTFHVERVSRNDPRPVQEATESEEEDRRLIELNPAAWQEEWAKAEKQEFMPGLPREVMVRSEAWRGFASRKDLKRPKKGK